MSKSVPKPITYAIKSCLPSYLSKCKLATINLERLNKDDNRKHLTTGILNRQNVLPKSISLEENEKKIGVFQPAVLDDVESLQRSNYIYSCNKLLGRTARVFFQDDNHMHNVPTLKKGYKWAVQLERQGVYKLPATGWTYNNDSFSIRTVYFKEFEHAINYCRENGFAYDVQYPHFRYSQKKSYADNFKWKGFPKNEEDF